MPDIPDYTDSELMDFMEENVLSYTFNPDKKFKHEVDWFDLHDDLRGLGAGDCVRDAITNAMRMRKFGEPSNADAE